MGPPSFQNKFHGIFTMEIFGQENGQIVMFMVFADTRLSLSLSFYMYIQKCWCEFKTTNILRIYYVCEKICVNWSVNPPKVDRYRKCATIPDPGALHCTPINALHSTHGSSNQWWLRKRCTCVNLYRKLYHFKAFVHIWSSRQNWDLFKLYHLTRAQRTLVNHMTYQPCSGYVT